MSTDQEIREAKNRHPDGTFGRYLDLINIGHKTGDPAMLEAGLLGMNRLARANFSYDAPRITPFYTTQTCERCGDPLLSDGRCPNE